MARRTFLGFTTAMARPDTTTSFGTGLTHFVTGLQVKKGSHWHHGLQTQLGSQLPYGFHHRYGLQHQPGFHQTIGLDSKIC